MDCRAHISSSTRSPPGRFRIPYRPFDRPRPHRPGTTAMAATRKLLASDLGAESGRGVLGLCDGQRMGLEVAHRFPNGPVPALDTLHWDVLRLHGDILATLQLCAGKFGGIV